MRLYYCLHFFWVIVLFRYYTVLLCFMFTFESNSSFARVLLIFSVQGSVHNARTICYKMHEMHLVTTYQRSLSFGTHGMVSGIFTVGRNLGTEEKPPVRHSAASLADVGNRTRVALLRGQSFNLSASKSVHNADVTHLYCRRQLSYLQVCTYTYGT